MKRESVLTGKYKSLIAEIFPIQRAVQGPYYIVRVILCQGKSFLQISKLPGKTPCNMDGINNMIKDLVGSEPGKIKVPLDSH